MYFFICLFVCLLAYEVMGNGNVYCVSSTRITIEGIEKLNKNKTINSREPLDSLLLLPWLKKKIIIITEQQHTLGGQLH